MKIRVWLWCILCLVGIAPAWAQSPPQLTIQQGHKEGVHRMAFSADGKLLASSSLDHTVHLWDTANGWELAVWDADGEMLNGLAFSADGRVVAGAKGGKIILWDTVTGQKLRTLSVAANISDLLFTPDGKKLLLATEAAANFAGGALLEVDATNGQILRTLAQKDTGLAIYGTPDRHTLLTTNYFTDKSFNHHVRN